MVLADSGVIVDFIQNKLGKRPSGPRVETRHETRDTRPLGKVG